MLGLTLKHPWPWAFLLDPPFKPKDIENRKWRPEPRHVGQWIALHGGVIPKGKDYLESLADHTWMLNRKLCPEVNLASTFIGGIFAVCKFGEPVKESDSPWFFGPWGWPVIELIRLPEAIPCKGQLGLWELPEDVLARVRDGYRESKSS